MKHTPLLAVVGLLLTGSLSACSSSTEVKDSQEALSDASHSADLLAQAQEVKLDKAALSVGDSWTVRVGDREVATMEGLALPVLGDTYSILSPKGGLLAGEEEQAFSPTIKRAKFFDQHKHYTKELTKDFWSFMASYHLKDSQKRDLARLDEHLGWTFQGTILDGDGKPAWTFSKAALSVGDSLTLKKVGGGKVSTLDALRMVAVANEINNSKSKHH